MKIGKAFVAGVVGGVATSMLGAMARALGLPVQMEEMLGSMFTGEFGSSAFVLGLTMHLVISGLIALLYAVGFEYGTKKAGWRVGAAFSLVHTLLAGLFTIVLPLIHPLMSSDMSPASAFMANMGAVGVLFFILIHVVYGATVGAIYGMPDKQDQPM